MDVQERVKRAGAIVRVDAIVRALEGVPVASLGDPQRRWLGELLFCVPDRAGGPRRLGSAGAATPPAVASALVSFLVERMEPDRDVKARVERLVELRGKLLDAQGVLSDQESALALDVARWMRRSLLGSKTQTAAGLARSGR